MTVPWAGMLVLLQKLRFCGAPSIVKFVRVAAMPALSVDDDAVGIAKRGVAGKALFHGAQDSPLFFLAVGVKMIEFGGQFPGANRIFHAEKFNYVASHVHAPGGVDSGRDTKTDFAGCRRTFGGNLRDFEQRLEPWIHRTA